MSKTLQTTLHRQSPVQCCPNTLWTTLRALVKTLWNLVKKAPGNIAHVKILLNVVLILFRQDCRGKNPVQCYPRDSRKHCTGNPGIVVWPTLLFCNFYVGLVSFLIITSCCKCPANIAQISLTLHKKNSGPTLNKKIPGQYCTEKLHEAFFSFLLQSSYLKQIFLHLSVWFFVY